MPITLVKADIARVPADAVVNAANSRLLPGAGVSGAIHLAGGPAIAAECARYVLAHGLVPRGEAVATTAGRLRARYVIHAVGPIWHGGRAGEAQDLRSAYRRCVEVADRLGCRTIVFPSISTGVFGYPVELAAPSALASVEGALAAAEHTRDATFALFDDETLGAYLAARSALEL
jgi:O-acetyl-ADP-ribose deacetylase (regulator of RNase III)